MEHGGSYGPCFHPEDAGGARDVNSDGFREPGAVSSPSLTSKAGSKAEGETIYPAEEELDHSRC